MTLAVSFVPDAGEREAVPPRSLYAVPAVPAGTEVLSPARTTPAGSISVLHPPAGRDAVAPLRLTRRGVVVLVAVVAMLGVGLMWLAARSAPTAAAARSVPASVTVRAGDTLWSIASRVAPQTDPRAEVAALQRANQLTGVGLVPGQILRIPH
jgi:nucleoid-associated protein YgaU